MLFLTFVCCFSRFLLYFYEGIFHKLCKRCSNVMMLLNLYIFPLFWPNIWGIWNILGKNIWGIWNIRLFDFSWFPLQIGLMVYHFRYNVDYQTCLVLLTKSLLHHAKSFSAFSVTFASGNENHFSFPEWTIIINKLKIKNVWKRFLLWWQQPWWL